MDGWQVVLLILGILVLLSAPLWRGLLRRWISNKGAELGDRAMRRNQVAHDTAFRTATDLDTDHATAVAAITAAERKGKAKPAETDVWHVAAVYKNAPLITRLVAIPGGHRLVVTQAIFHEGSPILSQAWTVFRDRVAVEAATLGVTTRLTEVTD